MDYIGKRISILKKEEELSIVILADTNTRNQKWFLLWIIAWSLSGVAVISQFYTIKDNNTQLAVFIWFAFWLYFEFVSIKSYLWKKFGKEKIKIKKDTLQIKRDIRGRGKRVKYSLDLINDLRWVEKKEKNFFDFINNSYWAIAGETLSFRYFGKEIGLGLQLDKDDAQKLLHLVKQEIKIRLNA